MLEEELKKLVVDLQRLEKIIITVPSCFTEPAKEVLKTCLLKAITRSELVDKSHRVLKEKRVIFLPEPEAGMQTYFASMVDAANQSKIAPGSFVSLFDLGGGTSDAANVVALSLDPQILKEDQPLDVTLGTDHGSQTLNELFAAAMDEVLVAANFKDADHRQWVILNQMNQFDRLKTKLTIFDEDYRFVPGFRAPCVIPK